MTTTHVALACALALVLDVSACAANVDGADDSTAVDTAAVWNRQPFAFGPAPIAGARRNFDPVDQWTWCLDCVGVDYTTGSPWAVNPTTCMWDTDDRYNYAGTGLLAAGASVSVSDCAFPQNHVWNVHGVSPSPDLVITQEFIGDFDRDGVVETRSVPILPVYDAPNHQYDYAACGRVPYVGSPGAQAALPLVPGAHDGRGIQIEVRVTVTNPTSHTVSKSGVWPNYGWQSYFAAGCS